MGASKKIAANQMTALAASVFQRIAGQPPGGAKFLAFLKALFVILRERASAQGQVKALELSRREKST